jgi:hypothetical protein
LALDSSFIDASDRQVSSSLEGCWNSCHLHFSPAFNP